MAEGWRLPTAKVVADACHF